GATPDRRGTRRRRRRSPWRKPLAPSTRCCTRRRRARRAASGASCCRPSDRYRSFRAAWLSSVLSATSACFHLPKATDQGVRRAVVSELRLRGALELRNDALREDLTELDAPLIERVDLPDGALREHVVLVESDERAQRFRREPLGQDRVRRTVALDPWRRHEPVRRALRLHLLGRLAEGQRLALGKDVRQQHVVMPAERIERLGERDEVAGDEPRPLMDQLIKRMLAVGSRLA